MKVAFSKRVFATLLLVALPTLLQASTPTFARFAYVANNKDDTVSIFAIERARLRSAGYIYTGKGSNPRSLVVTPAQTFLYVAEGGVGIGGYSINVINGQLTAVPGSPFHLGAVFKVIMHPSGRFIVAATGSRLSIYAINPNTGTLSLLHTVLGGSPTAAAFEPTGAFLFATNVNSDSISALAVNQSSGALTQIQGSPFPCGFKPQSVEIALHGKFLYVPNGSGGNISGYAIDPVTGALAQVSGSPFPAGSIPVAAVNKNSFLYVANSADKTISQYAINPTTGTLSLIAAPFVTGNSGPLALTISPTEPLLYVADYDSNEVVVLGIRTNGTLYNESSTRSRGNAISIALAKGGTAVTYSARFVYECNSAANNIWGYHVTSATGSLLPLDSSPYTTGASPLAIVSDFSGAFAFTVDAGSHTVSAFNVNSETGVLSAAAGSPYPLNGKPSAVAVDTGAHYVYVASVSSNTIAGFVISSDGVLASVPGSPFTSSESGPQATVIDPRGKFLYVANSQSNTVSTFVIDPGNGGLTQVASVSTATLPAAMSITPDGKYLYVLNQFSQNISAYAIDSVTGQLMALDGSPFAGAGPSKSIIIDALGERVYLGAADTILAYQIFDNRGSIRALSGSPFGGVSGAYSLGIDLSNSFLYAANNISNTLSSFGVNKTSGVIVPLLDSPYPAGSNPVSVVVVNNLQ